MSRSRLSLLALSIVALMLIALTAAVVGCGGGGAGGGGGSTGPTVVNVALVGLYSGTESPASGTSSALTLQVGDQIAFSYVGVSSTDNQQQVTVQGSQITTNAPSSVAVVNGNVLTITGSSAKSYTLTGVYQGTVLTVTFTAAPLEAKLSGVVNDTNGAPVAGVSILLYNGSTITARTTSGANGTFIVDTPTSSTSFTANLVSPTYYNEYIFNSLNYSATIGTSCHTPLPALQSGKITSLPHPIVFYIYQQSSPPPAPSGCG